jgi:sporulation protein YlmC with PRC-barrel domain
VLYRLRKLVGLPIKASDGEIGKIKDVYFDDYRWTLRYLVVDTGGWLVGRKVLVSANSIASIDWDESGVQVGLIRNQIEASPHIDTDKPVSRQHEAAYFDYYGYPYYWSGPSFWGKPSHPGLPLGAVAPVTNAPGEFGEAPVDPHLRSANEVSGYRIHTSDASIGHVEDFLLDEVSWTIRYLIVDTRNWLPGKHIVIPPDWITEVDWSENVVNVDVTRETVQAAPEYHAGMDFSRAQETHLYRQYRRPSYWQQLRS